MLLEAEADIADASPDTMVVVLTMQEDPAFAREARSTRGALRARGASVRYALDNDLIDR